MEKNINKIFKLIEDNKYQELFNFLQDKHADIDLEIINNDNETPLILSTKLGYINISIFLLSLGANVDVVDNFGFSPLLYSCINNMIELVKYILENNLNSDNKHNILENKNIHGNTPLISACYSACYEIIQMLIKNGASVNSKNNKGNTPLFGILTFNSKYKKNIVRTLLRNGAQVNISNTDGITPLELAWQGKDFKEITQILIYEGNAIPTKKLLLNSEFLKNSRKYKLETL